MKRSLGNQGLLLISNLEIPREQISSALELESNLPMPICPEHIRTETDDKLHPIKATKTCLCGVQFHTRPIVLGEDASKCLSCNRKHWSRLHK
jgi:hypothetical protein